MSLITIFLFFVYTYGLGFAITSFVKESENILERNLMRIGIGLGVFVLLGVILNFFHIPLDWKIFLLLSIIFPFIYIIKKLNNKDYTIPFFKFTKENIFIFVVLAIFLFSAHMYIGGSFNYPYLEDDDPWEHAITVQYVATEKTITSDTYLFQYMDPYPPGYDMLLGVLHQTSDSINWTLKFFNGLIIALGLIFFYFFAKLFMKDKNHALIATFILACIPSFFTHFIWSQSLAIMLFFPAMYCLEMIKTDKKWMYIGMVVISAILLTQPTKAIKIGIMLGIYWLIKSIWERDWNTSILLAELGGLGLSLIWWATRWKSFLSFNSGTTTAGNVTLSLWQKIQAAFPYDSGTATQPYTFNDFFVAQPFGGINVHIGWGVIVSILLMIGLIAIIIKYKETFTKENVWIPISLGWFIFTFLGVNSMTFNLPIGFYAFRFWLLLAIPVAILSVLGIIFITKFTNKIGIPTILVIILICGGVLLTSGYQKYNQNHNAIWPPGANWGSQEELQGFMAIQQNIPKDTKIFGICSNESSGHIIGFDMQDASWNTSLLRLKQDVTKKSPQTIYTFMKAGGYQFVLIDTRCSVYYGVNETSIFLNDLVNSTYFIPAYQTQGLVLLQVR